MESVKVEKNNFKMSLILSLELLYLSKNVKNIHSKQNTASQVEKKGIRIIS